MYLIFLFNNVPTKNSTGQFVSAVGYRYGTRIRHLQPPIIYWQRPDNFAYASNTINSIREVLHGKPNTQNIWPCVEYYLELYLAKGQTSETVRGKLSDLKHFIDGAYL